MNNLFDDIKKIFKSRNLKYGTNSFILIAAVVAIAVFVNILVDMANLKWDLTPNKIYSIGDTTKEILDGLNKDVTIYGLFDDGKVGADDQYKEIVELLAHYEKNPRVKVEYVDPDRNPGVLKELDPDGTMDLRSNDFVVMSGNKKKKLDVYDLFDTMFDEYTFSQRIVGSTAEQGFTGAIKYVTSDVTPVVYFVQGHGEFDTDIDLGNVKTYLERNNYDVKTVNLLTVEKVPEDAEMLVVASPKSDISQDEKDKIREYLKNGGKGMFLFDYLSSDPEFAQFEDLLKDYNVALNYDRVKENDPSRHFPGRQYTIILDVNSSAIIPQDFNIVLDNSRSIRTLKNEKEYIKVTSLMKTSEQAVGELVDKSRGDDIAGPLDVAVAVQHDGGYYPVKIIVMGNGSFITDDAESIYGPYYNNGMLFFLQSLNWMLDKEDDTVIAPKTYYNPTIQITAKEANIMGLAVVILLPVIILGVGLFVFLRRRHL